MNIAIIVHSQTGNTYSVGMRLRDALTGAGHGVRLERVKADGPVKPHEPNVNLAGLPDITDCDAVILGAPVHAFSLSPLMQAYLEHITSLADKRVAGLVTMFFPFAWMGGNRALRQMRRACEAKGAQICGMGVVNWCRPTREAQINTLVSALSASIQQPATGAPPTLNP